ncbi:hypothetical protein SPRG_17109, partial [Saprolegnia parasitica CBS 223.65]
RCLPQEAQADLDGRVQALKKTKPPTIDLFAPDKTAPPPIASINKYTDDGIALGGALSTVHDEIGRRKLLAAIFRAWSFRHQTHATPARRAAARRGRARCLPQEAQADLDDRVEALKKTKPTPPAIDLFAPDKTAPAALATRSALRRRRCLRSACVGYLCLRARFKHLPR